MYSYEQITHAARVLDNLGFGVTGHAPQLSLDGLHLLLTLPAHDFAVVAQFAERAADAMARHHPAAPPADDPFALCRRAQVVLADTSVWTRAMLEQRMQAVGCRFGRAKAQATIATWQQCGWVVAVGEGDDAKTYRFTEEAPA